LPHLRIPIRFKFSTIYPITPISKVFKKEKKEKFHCLITKGNEKQIETR